MDRKTVETELSGALTSLLRNQLESVSVSEPIEDPQQPLRFTSRYTQRIRDELHTGLVRYDVPSSTMGPDELPAIVKNHMRTEVHKKLTAHGTDARKFVESLK